MHGKLDFKINACDILCICGDIVPLNVQAYHKGTIKWLKNTFIPWCNEQPCERVFLIAGNHDIVFENYPDEIINVFKDTKITYLCDEEAEYVKEDEENYESIRIYGTPWCHQFYDWAFMTSDLKLESIYSKIPYKVDVLLTHDCPYGTSDVLLQKNIPWANGDHIGCHPLGNAVDEKKPRFHCCGHLHSCEHKPQERGETTVCNVSMVDEHYDRVYEPHYFEI